MASSGPRNLTREVKVGIFMMVGIVLFAIAVVSLGSSSNIFTSSHQFVTFFPSVEGLIPGAKVAIGGLQVGTVVEVDFDPKEKKLRAIYKVASKYAQWVRSDSEVEILTQGMLGDKYVAISVGSTETPAIEDGGTLPFRQGKDISQFIAKGDTLLVSLTSIAGSLDSILKGFEKNGRSEKLFDGLSSTAQNASSISAKVDKQLDGIKANEAVAHLNSILAKIDNGTGTIGALINDPTLYYDLRALMGGANRNKLVRNLVRQSIRDGERRSE